MAPNIEDQHAYWTNLGRQAMAGEFRMEHELGETLRAAAAKYAERLSNCLDDASRLGQLSGWGSLPSAVALRTKFEQKAVGGGIDPTDNVMSRLREHIEIAWLQHDTFAAAISKLELIDEERATALRTTTDI
ncbi:hypothetical protein ACL02S_11585 [Nocardia sp. 004]|uniref:hypothetical protein n=1 Tax=Nocardia sp. 004 TaxID=3385978 RepID=UPI0039A2B0BE